ncbi:MAG: YafY family protein [Chloroflexota bacterium]
MNRVDRLLGYLLIFQGKELVRAQDLADRFEISERTVYRDIDALCELGVPLYGVAGEGYRLMDGYYLPPIMFTEQEARALFLAISMLTGFTPDGETRAAAQSAMEKIRTVLPEVTLAQVEALQSTLGFYIFRQQPHNLDDPKFALLLQAIQSRKVIQMSYHAMHNNRVTERTVEPLQLNYLDSAWVLYGYCRLRQDLRNFRLERIDTLTVTSEIFSLRVTKPPPRVIDGRAEVVVRFEPSIVRWVREAQHFTFVEERTSDQDDGSIMIYRTRADQIVRWLLSWGDTFEVLEPTEIRDEIARTAKQLWVQHQSGAFQGGQSSEVDAASPL